MKRDAQSELYISMVSGDCIHDRRVFEELPISANTVEVGGCHNTDNFVHCRGFLLKVKGGWWMCC